MPDVPPESLHADLVAWGVLEASQPVRFTRRFQGSLARAAAELQAAEKGGQGTGGQALENQVETALGAFLRPTGKKAGPGHRRFVLAVHVASLPEAVRRLLGA